MRMAARGPRAFSLIELLVVVAVVGVLLAIALPMLASSRTAARATKCLVQSQQIVAGVVAFSTDNGGRLPANRTRTSPGEYVTWRWAFVEKGYVSAGGAFACPAHPDGEPGSELGANDGAAVCVGDVPASHALNGHLLWRLDAPPAAGDRIDAAVLRPSHTAALVETRAAFPDMRVIAELLATQDARGGLYGFWHAKRGTYAFLDGHAEQIGFMATGSPDCRWHNGRDLTPDPFDPQDPRELQPHDHPDWEFLVSPVYLR